MSNLFDLSGKVALVVGGHGGIGKAIALGLADAGADVIVASRNLEALKGAVKDIEARGRKSLAVTADIVDEKQQLLFSVSIALIVWEKRRESLENNFPKKKGGIDERTVSSCVLKKPGIGSGGKKGFPDFRDGIN